MSIAEQIQAAIDTARGEGRDVPAVMEELIIALAKALDLVTPAAPK